ncbi:hypothetical protein EX30DRAFT_264698 [Ascodesmis nigricans]|uniref:Transcription factor domain-containing protein n=1 Tax=Ascodesmis nigricans TaxID=341454 RepID=A0A4S2MXW4_9PEZI|nr:hypothetical protein EX30DRAFT_264698 [Ascodesmis nigricans]
MEEDENEDAEYRYGSQEDGMIAMETSNHGQIQHQQISEILRPFSKHLDEHSRISFQSFLPEASALASYMPTLSSSPLMNPVTAKIFCHFVYVLGPRLHGPQNIWSYTIPMLSLSHPPLLHAILALSSLHISKLTKGGDKPSLLHYHIALRRLGKAIASDRHRGHVATLAATLMLAYYETMAAEHDKWSSHIHGAKQLLKEVDFDRVTKRVELADDEEALITEQRPANGASLLHQRRLRRQMIADDQVDDNFKSLLMGSKVKRQNKAKKAHSDRPFTKKELETLRLQSDLFWWYTKMDCFQSLLSGCPLVLDYIHWDQCPPRSRIGTLGTPYGSSDHYFLLLGRLCDFQVRDLARKKAVLAANNGQWIPPPEMNGPPRSQRPHFAPPNYIAPPVQYGMIPTPNGPPRMPSAFGAVPVPSNYPSPPSASEDLHTLTDAALQEWNEIKAAFEALQTSLGPDYDPLPLEYMPVQHTPFGDALYYKSYSIASLQMLYSMALIVLHRCHPDMPPQSMMAASIQSPRTTPHANTIARIVAGLVPTDVTTQINPALGASLIEASMPMFFSAVQFQLPEQRDWAVRKLREIHRLTGWATASRILLGCQRAWEMLAEKGKGPKYERPRMEEEAEMFYEYHNYYVALAKGARDEARVVEEVEGGQGEAMWRWKVSGRRTVDAAGILGERMDAGGVAGLGLEGA